MMMVNWMRRQACIWISLKEVTSRRTEHLGKFRVVAWTGTMPSKKKKPASDASPRPDTPSSPTTESAADGVILNIFDDATGPSACAVLHWETASAAWCGPRRHAYALLAALVRRAP